MSTQLILRLLEGNFRNPLKPEEIIWRNKVAADIREYDNNTVWLYSLRSFEIKMGYGSMFMRTLCELSDEMKVIIRLDASPFPTDVCRHPMTEKKIIEYYRRFGFATCNAVQMIRYPR